MVELLIQRCKHSLATRDSRSRPGFTLVEVLLSMTILAVGILVLGGLFTRSARSGRRNGTGGPIRAGMIATEAARNDALPFDQLVAGTTCSTTSGAPLPHTLCTTITVLSAKVKQAKDQVHPDLELSGAGGLGDVRAQISGMS